MNDSSHPFSHLTPQGVLDALDSCGWRGDGRLLQLNSYENRVFQVGLENGGYIVAKFYRPGRWSDAQIAEEHAFTTELRAAEVPVIAPFALSGAHGGASMAHVSVGGHPFRLAVYPCCAGRAPELDDAPTLQRLGRLIGRLHAVGATARFMHRRTLDVSTFGTAALSRIEAMAVVPPAQLAAWRDVSQRALATAAASIDAHPAAPLRLHGDCHPGNLLWREDGPHAVDFDDAVNGPAIQDLWMLMSGEPEARRSQLALLLEGYRQFRPFDLDELALIEPLRTLRMVHHSAWLAERWDDPAFPAAFPWFGAPAYWSQQTQELRDQLDAMAEPPLDASWL